jgi:broad specificity phosphatase PhoE
VLLVAHGGFKRAVIAALMQKGPEYIGRLGQSRNTGVTIVRIEKGKKARVVTRNCTKHLA